MPGLRLLSGARQQVLQQPADHPEAGQEEGHGVLGGHHWQRHRVLLKTSSDARETFY